MIMVRWILMLVAALVIGDLRSIETTLRTRQANWRLTVVDRFSDGSPKQVVFFEPIQGESCDLPVKIVQYSPEGDLYIETDVYPAKSGEIKN